MVKATVSNENSSMVAERRLTAMEDSISNIEEAIINMEVHKIDVETEIKAFKDEMLKTLQNMLQVNMDSINKSISASSKLQMTKIDGIMETVEIATAQNLELNDKIKKIENQFVELEININCALKNISEHGIKADHKNTHTQ